MIAQDEEHQLSISVLNKGCKKSNYLSNSVSFVRKQKGNFCRREQKKSYLVGVL
jgi:hypothetical protein